MPVTVVVGGQYGSEGKGKVAAYFAEKLKATAVIRCGGTNSGHTVYRRGSRYVFRQLPTAAIIDKVHCLLASGSYIELSVLEKEIELAKLPSDRLFIDPYAMIITNEHMEKEINDGLVKKIGSTGSGTGSAIKARVSRTEDILFAKDIPSLANYICDTKRKIYDYLRKNKRLLVEGTQGFGLSVLHSQEYPYVTSRDTTAAGFISECGISPMDVDEVIMTIRSYPIRVAGNSGPLKNEISWELLSEESGLSQRLIEYTSVTQQIRRVARFDPDIVTQSLIVNRPTKIVLNHLDYIQNEKRNEFIATVEQQINRKVDYVGLNPYTLDAADNYRRRMLHAI